MKRDVILNKLENNEITSKEALDLLYPVKKQKMGKKAYFVKMKIIAREEGKGVNRLLRILFALPFPIILARIGLRFAGRFIKDEDFDISEISKMLKYSKNTVIDIDSKDATVKIKVI